MSEPDAVPLPREGEVFFDVRGESRTMRLSWYADSSVAVFSIWQGNRCTSTFRLPFVDLARMIDTLRAGPPSRTADPGSLQQGQPPYANRHADPGYGYPESGAYGQPAAHAPVPGYGSEPHYGTGPDYGYPERDDGVGGPGRSDRHYDREYPAASGGQDYGPPDRYGAPDAYGGHEPYGTEFDQGGPPRYVPDVAGQTGPYQPAANFVPESHGYAEPPGYVQSHGYPEPPEYPQSRGYPDSQGYPDSHGYPESHQYAEPHEYAGPHGGAGSRDDYRDQYSGAYRSETQFLAAPPAVGERSDTQAPGWREDWTEPQGDHSQSARQARPAKTEQLTADWGPATASHRPH